jgi:pimeloyl-ACP methyl ester carboxylesterase
MTRAFSNILIGLAIASQTLASDLQQRFNHEQRLVERGSPASEADLNKVRGLEVLLVNGFMVDRVGKKPFEDFKRALDRDWDLRAVESVQPASSKSISDNADLLVADLESRSSRGPLLIVGHSKGAAEALVAMLKKPELLNRDIKVVLLQGALRGAKLASLSDSFCSSNEALGLCDVLPFTGEGLESLKRANQTALVERLKPKDGNTRALIQSKVFTIASFAKNANGMASMFQASHLYLGREGRNDAVLNTVDGEWTDLATPLGVLEANHVEFTGGEGQNQTRTRALVSLILKSLNR